MKILVILVPILLQLASGDPSYADTTTGEFVTGNCQSAPAGSIKSPIFVEESLCAIYGTFSLTMDDIPAGGAFSSEMPVVASMGAPSAAYTGAKLESNGTSYTSTDYLIRTASEHVLFRDGRQADAEIQILMDSDAGDGSKAILSFLVIETPSGTGSNIYSNSVNAKVIPTTAATAWQVNFNSLAQRISKHADYEVFLNMFTYEGTQTWGTCDAVRWFIYGSELYIDAATLEAIRTQTQTYTGAANKVGASDVALTHNARPYTGTGGGGGAVVIYRMCYNGYFKVHLDVNYGLWFGMVSILLFFLFTLSYGDKPIKDYDYHERVSTIHPIVSIFTVGNEIHTVKTRASLLLAMVTVHGLFSSVFFRDASDPKKSSNVIVFAIYSMLIDWPITLFVGGILRKYYLAKYQYYKTKEEAWDQKAQNRLFGFYTAVFVIAVVGWSFCVWNMAELHPEIDEEASKLWVAAFFIGLGLELLLIYPLVCVLARSSNFIRRIAKSVGFMYDNLCHETYMDFLKHD